VFYENYWVDDTEIDALLPWLLICCFA